MRAVGEAGMERSAEIGELWDEMLLMVFRVRQDLSEMRWDRFLDEHVSGLFEGRAWAFAYPV